jgi:hypothetical protein
MSCNGKAKTFAVGLKVPSGRKSAISVGRAFSVGLNGLGR